MRHNAVILGSFIFLSIVNVLYAEAFNIELVASEANTICTSFIIIENGSTNFIFKAKDYKLDTKQDVYCLRRELPGFSGKIRCVIRFRDKEQFFELNAKELKYLYFYSGKQKNVIGWKER